MFFVYLFCMVLKNIEHASIFHWELLHETIFCFKMTSCNEEIKLHFCGFFLVFLRFFSARQEDASVRRKHGERENQEKTRAKGEAEERPRRLGSHSVGSVGLIFKKTLRTLWCTSLEWRREIFFLRDMVPWYKSGEISKYVKEKEKAK